ncbi:rifin PIR protein, putative [Plasmodium reichenowi]|uniref:Rifin PIR protein, putative n=1 Tax=Plasmodium reichenowi TaxID=5854 RepID=A0A2P9DHF9_PLARE|nr:rifin PIR protein, putative [Plasmodium reichenowi]
MKLNYSKILLFFILLNILVTLYQVNTHRKPHTTPRYTPRYTSRILSECDVQSSIYDKNADIQSVKEQFDDRTSQRFEEYEERMKVKRQKRKEQRDKNIQKIIHKDKMEKNLAEKIEIGCLRCGCALGGVAASVGVFGGLGIYGSKNTAIAAAKAEAMVEGLAAGEAARIQTVKSAVIAGITEKFGVSIQGVHRFESLFTAENYRNATKIALAINSEYDPSSCLFGTSRADPSNTICPWVMENFVSVQKIPGNQDSIYKSIEVAIENIVSDEEPIAETAAQQATNEVIQKSIDAVEFAYSGCQTAIIASVVTILIYNTWIL